MSNILLGMQDIADELADFGSFRRSILHSVQHILPSPTILDQYAAFRAT
jgi:hypothetical protein